MYSAVAAVLIVQFPARVLHPLTSLFPSNSSMRLSDGIRILSLPFLFYALREENR